MYFPPRLRYSPAGPRLGGPLSPGPAPEAQSRRGPEEREQEFCMAKFIMLLALAGTFGTLSACANNVVG